MKTTTKIIATALTVISLAAVSVVAAHPGGGYGMGQGSGMGMGMGMGPSVGMMGSGQGMGQGMGSGHGRGVGMGAMGFESPAVLTARLGDMKTALKISADQDAAWQKYAVQVQQQMQSRQTFHTTMQAQMQDPKVSIDRNAQHETMTKLFAGQDAARTELLAVLTPEQKAQFGQQRGSGHGHGNGQRMGPQAPTK